MQLTPLLLLPSLLSLAAAGPRSRCCVLTARKTLCHAKPGEPDKADKACHAAFNFVCAKTIHSTWAIMTFDWDPNNVVWRAICVYVPLETVSGDLTTESGIPVHWDCYDDHGGGNIALAGDTCENPY